MPYNGQVKPGRILVVDDEPVIRDMMVDILDFEGHEPLIARNGKEALAHVWDEEGYLIFLDLMMPVLDGYEFCQRLSIDPEERGRHIVVVMSALDNLAQVTGLDVDATMPKPFTIDDVGKMLDRYMG
jgi:CheY-like chemotaxis protein